MAKRRFFAKKLRYRENSLLRPKRYGDGSNGIDTKPIEEELDRRMTTHAKDSEKQGENQLIRGHKRFNDTIQMVDRDPFYSGYVKTSQETDKDGNVYTDSGKFPSMSLFTKNRLDSDDPDKQIEGRTSYSGIGVSTKTFSGLGEDAMMRNANAGLLFSSTKVSDTAKEKNKWDTTLSLCTKNASLYMDADNISVMLNNTAKKYYTQTVDELDIKQLRLLLLMLIETDEGTDYGDLRIVPDSRKALQNNELDLYNFMIGTNQASSVTEEVAYNLSSPSWDDLTEHNPLMHVYQMYPFQTLEDYARKLNPSFPTSISSVKEMLFLRYFKTYGDPEPISDVHFQARIKSLLLYYFATFAVATCSSADDVDSLVDDFLTFFDKGIDNPYEDTRKYFVDGKIRNRTSTPSISPYFITLSLIPKSDREDFIDSCKRFFGRNNDDFFYLKKFIDSTSSKELVRPLVRNILDKLNLKDKDCLEIIRTLKGKLNVNKMLYIASPYRDARDDFLYHGGGIDNAFVQRSCLTIASMFCKVSEKYMTADPYSYQLDERITRQIATRAIVWSSLGFVDTTSIHNNLSALPEEIWPYRFSLMRAFVNTFRMKSSEIDSGVNVTKYHRDTDVDERYYEGSGSVVIEPSDSAYVSIGTPEKYIKGVFSENVRTDYINVEKIGHYVYWDGNDWGTDSITLDATGIIPKEDIYSDLGSSNKRYDTVYAKNLQGLIPHVAWEAMTVDYMRALRIPVGSIVLLTTKEATKNGTMRFGNYGYTIDTDRYNDLTIACITATSTGLKVKPQTNAGLDKNLKHTFCLLSAFNTEADGVFPLIVAMCIEHGESLESRTKGKFKAYIEPNRSSSTHDIEKGTVIEVTNGKSISYRAYATNTVKDSEGNEQVTKDASAGLTGTFKLLETVKGGKGVAMVERIERGTSSGTRGWHD